MQSEAAIQRKNDGNLWAGGAQGFPPQPLLPEQPPRVLQGRENTFKTPAPNDAVFLGAWGGSGGGHGVRVRPARERRVDAHLRSTALGTTNPLACKDAAPIVRSSLTLHSRTPESGPHVAGITKPRCLLLFFVVEGQEQQLSQAWQALVRFFREGGRSKAWILSGYI